LEKRLWKNKGENKMRVCPKCGCVDSPYWKHTKFSYYIDQCIYENFAVELPKLAAELNKPNSHTQDVNYLYYRTKSGKIVLRKAKIGIGVTLLPWTDGCESGKQGWKRGRSKLPDKQNIRDFAKHWVRYWDKEQCRLLEEPTK
jgi:hypothetical protein